VTGNLAMDAPLRRVADDVALSTPTAALAPVERATMFELLATYFDGVNEVVFERDLAEKNWVLRILRDGSLVGFTTLQVYAAQRGGQRLNIIYSGDTIMAPEAWGAPVLARGWISLVRALREQRGAEPWYWLLLSSGFRTYRFLPVFWREFWPRHDAEPPAVVRFVHPQRLRGPLAAIPEGRALCPDVRFFLQRNPGHVDGDELVCLTELSDANLTSAGRRMIRGGSP
jgi:hypothetical protein